MAVFQLSRLTWIPSLDKSFEGPNTCATSSGDI